MLDYNFQGFGSDPIGYQQRTERTALLGLDVLLSASKSVLSRPVLDISIHSM